MKIHRLDKASPPLWLLAPHPLNAFAAIVRNRRTDAVEPDNKISYWQLIFLQSRANGCFHRFEDMPQARWQWPRNTWFQERKSQKLSANSAAQKLNN